jgi:hypothetical protein
MRKPDDKRAIDVAIAICDWLKLRCAVRDWILVLMVEAIAELLKKFESASPPIAKPAYPQTISNDGMNSGDACLLHMGNKRWKSLPNSATLRNLYRGKP